MTHLHIPVPAITRCTLARTHELKMIVYVSIDSVSGTIFKILFQIQPENFFLTTSNHRQAKICLFLGINLLVQLLHLPLKFHLSKLSPKEKPFWIPSQNSEYPRIFRVPGANQKAPKSLSTDLVNTKTR